MMNPRYLRIFLFGIWAAAFCTISLSTARAQFTLTPSALTPPAVDPGDSAIGHITVAAVPGSGFDSPVSFSCSVTSSPVATNPPTCLVSPASATPPATPTLTINTCPNPDCPNASTPPYLYTITVTGVSGSSSASVTFSMSVINVTQTYTLSVEPTTATPSPVNPGDDATTTVTVSPIGSYTGSVTLSCLSVTPITATPPSCSFQYAPGTTAAVVTKDTPATATLVITTYGPVPTTKLWKPHLFYALALIVPGLLCAGVSGSNHRRRRLLGMLLLAAMAGGLLLLPTCGSKNTNNPSGNTTPKNTYTFTLTGVDQKGTTPSNSTSSLATVTLQVN